MKSIKDNLNKFFKDKKLTFRETESHFQLNCFLCTDKRERLGIDHSTGSWHCFNCQSGGKKISSLEYAFNAKGKFKTRDEIKKTEKEEKCSIPPELHKRFYKKIFKTKKNSVAKYLIKKRGLSQTAIKHFKLGARSKFFKKVNGAKESYDAGEHLAIPYLIDGKCVNLKYRAIDPDVDRKWKWRREKGGITTLFNDAVIDELDYTDIYIVESEIDCISLWELGIKNVIGLTAGAEGFKQSWYERLERFERIFLCLDNDEAGQVGAKKLAKRLGLGRCKNIILPEDVKDPNDFLLKYKLEDFQALSRKSKQYDVEDSVSLRSAMDSIYSKRFLEDNEEVTGYDTQFRNLNNVLGPLKPGYLTIVSAKPKVGKCVKWDSIVHDPFTNKPMTIQEAVNNKLSHIASYNENTRKIEIAKVSAHIDSGIKPMVEVKLKNGRAVTTTYSHRYLTFEGWKYVSELKEGDRIAVPTKLTQEVGVYSDIPLLHVLGAVIADGALKGNCSYTKKDTILVDLLSKNLDEAFNCKLNPFGEYSYRIIGNVHGVNPFLNYIRENGLDVKSTNKTRPSFIFPLKNELIAEFLGMLFSHDGSIYNTNDRTCLEYSSASEKLIDQMNHLFIRMGINLRKTAKSVKLNGKVFRTFKLSSSQKNTVLKFLEYIPMYGAKANFKIIENNSNKISRDYVYSFPIEVLDQIKKEHELSESEFRIICREANIFFRKTGGVSKAKLEKLNKVLKSDFVDSWINSDIDFTPIKSIEDVGEHQCYDLTVDVHHNFICNDIVAHNTTFVLNLMRYWADNSINVGMYQVEMRPDRIAEKYALMVVPDINKIEDSTPSMIREATNKLPIDKIHLYYPQPGDLEIEKICQKIREMVQRYGIKIFCFDNLHFLCRGENENAMIDIATRAFKLLAEELDIILILVTHPKKSPGNKQLRNEDMKGSSSIYQDADVIILLNRADNDGDTIDEMDNPDNMRGSKSPQCNFKITSRWHGGGNSVLVFHENKSLFSDKGRLYSEVISDIKRKQGKKKTRKGF